MVMLRRHLLNLLKKKSSSRYVDPILTTGLAVFAPLDRLHNGYADTLYPGPDTASDLLAIQPTNPPLVAQSADGRPCLRFPPQTPQNTSATAALREGLLPTTPGSSFTIAFWFWADTWTPPPPGFITLVTNQDSASVSPYRTIIVYRNDAFHLAASVANSTGTIQTVQINQPSIGAWHHYCLTFDGVTGLFTFYLDGVSQGQQTLSGNLYPSTAPIQFGDNYVGQHFAPTGYFRGYGRWTRALSAAEVTRLYRRGSVNDYPFKGVVPAQAAGSRTYSVDNSFGPATTGFQFYVDLGPNFDYSQPRPDGADLRVYAADGTTPLSYWTEYYDPVCGVGRVWVKPNLSAGGTTTVVVKWDGATSSSLSSFDGVMQKIAVDAGTQHLWHCDDGSGTTAADAVGGGTALSLTNVTWSGADGGSFLNRPAKQSFASGNALTFNGTSAYATAAGVLDTWPAAGTIAFWFKPTATYTGADYTRLLCKFNSNYSATVAFDGIDLFFDQSSLSLILAVNRGVNGNNSAQLQSNTVFWKGGTWYHVAITWDQNVWALHVNGEMECARKVGAAGAYEPATNGPPANGSANPLTLGCHNSGGTRSHFFAGEIDEVVVLSRAVLSEELAAMTRRRQYVAGMGQSGRWATATRQTCLNYSGSGFDAAGALEPTVVQESDGTYSMVYTGGNPITTTDALGRATSPDGLTWTRYGGNPVVAATANQSYVLKAGGTYYLFYCNGYQQGSDLYRATSADGVTWSAGQLVLAHSDAAGRYGMSNPCVVVSGSTWYLLCEVLSSVSPSKYALFLFTSTDQGLNWIPYVRNPVSDLLVGTGSYSGATLLPRAGGGWDLWYHVTPRGAIPSFVYHARGTADLRRWTRTVGPVIGFAGELLNGSSADQIADPHALDLGSEVRLYVDVDTNNTALGGGVKARIDLARYAGSRDKLVTDWPVVSG